MSFLFHAYGKVTEFFGEDEMFGLIDKTTWPQGPWQDEPDAYTVKRGNFLGVVVRNPMWGHINGYVFVPEDHPWYGRDTSQLYDIEVHGGVTYAEQSTDGKPYWVVGFDCNHSSDFAPAACQSTKLAEQGQAYKTFGYAMDETLKLIHAAAEAA